VACCYIEINGGDGKNHFRMTEASSAYQAIEQAIDAWSKYWWWNPSAVPVVRRGDQSWNIPVREVIEAIAKRLGKP
jgi:hypothetical protein